MRLTVISHLTLDGVMQSNGGPEPELNDGFEPGGWYVPHFDEDFVRCVADWIATADAFLIGRRSCELFAARWSQITDPNDALAAGPNRRPKHVVSTTLGQVEWSNSPVLRGDVPGAVA